MSFNTAQALFAVGNIEGAERELRRFLADNPEDSDAQCLLAHCHLMRQDREGARRIVERVLGQAPEFSSGWALLGQIEAGNGLYPRAEEAYLRALDLDPEEAFTHAGLASLYEAYGHTQKAIAQYEHSLALDPDDTDTLCDYAKLLLAQGKDAAALIERAGQIAPDAPEVILLMGELALREGHAEEAAERAIWVLEQDADNQDALMLLCTVQARQNLLLASFMRLHIWVNAMSFNRKAVLIGLLLVAFILLRMVIMALCPLWVHHLFVFIAVMMGGGLMISDTVMEMIIDRARRDVKLDIDY